MIGFSMGAYYVVPDSILGDCIDYDELHTGVRSESGYTVIETNLQQFMEVPAYAIPFTIVGLAGYLSNGGCGCGCGYGEDGCVNLPLGNSSVWQSALIVPEDDAMYASAISCGDSTVYETSNLDATDLCRPFLPNKGSFQDSCKAIAADGPCTLNDDGTFSGDDSLFGDEYCAKVKNYCTYQPPAVRWLFIIFQVRF